MTERLEAALADRYRIERELGEGGMATVYLADDLRHNRKVALKVLKPDVARMLGKQRFLSEIETTANLQHPNILPLFDSGEAGGFLFYVMPWVDGESLRDRLDREGQFAVDEAVRIAGEIAEALDHAHRHGVVHRDVKPANILLRDGRPLVADFGIALAAGTAGGTRLTETGLSLGTPYYMSPEQALGDQPVGAASDQYSLGCVLYEMLVGEPPHTGGSAQAILARIITGGAPPPVAQRASIPPNVDGAIRKSLERVPVDRFESAKAFAEALGNPGFRYGEEASAPRRGVSRAVAGVVGIVAALAGAVLGATLSDGADATPSAWIPGARPLQVTFSGRAVLPAISPDGEWVAYVESDSCRIVNTAVCRYDLVVRARDAGRPVTIVENLGDVSDLRFSRDGEAIAFSGRFAPPDDRRGLFALSRLGGAVRPIGPDRPFDFDAGGAAIWMLAPADSARSRLVRISWPDGTEEAELDVDVADAWAIRVSPDGQRFVLVTDETIALVARDGDVLDRRSAPIRNVGAWTPDGAGYLFFEVGTVREDDLVRVAVEDDGFGDRSLVRGGIPTNYEGAMDAALESGDVVFARGESGDALHVIDLTTRPLEADRIAAGTTWYGMPVAYDPSTIFYLRGDAIGDNLYRYDVATATETPLTEESSAAGAEIGVAPDGTRVGYSRRTIEGGGTQVGVVEIPSGRHRLYRMEGSFRPVQPVGDAALLGRDEVDGARVVRRVETSDELGTASTIPITVPAGSSPWIDDFAVSPDGSELVVRYGAAGLFVFGRVPVVGGVIDFLGAVPIAGELLPPEPTWVRDGVRVIRWVRADDAPSVWAVGGAPGQFERILELPVPCRPAATSIDPSSTILTCRTSDARTDILVLPGASRRR